MRVVTSYEIPNTQKLYDGVVPAYVAAVGSVFGVKWSKRAIRLRLDFVLSNHSKGRASMNPSITRPVES